MDRLGELNSAQRDAVQTLGGPLLVLAGAGTGKTRVITYRMAQLIDSGVRADRILSVTFTNKAAREMRQRTAALLKRQPRKKPWISTFHSLCVHILRQEIPALGYPATFSICDRSDQESVARSALRDVRVAEKSLRPGDLLSVISRWKSAGIAPESASDHVEGDLDFLAAVAYRRYQSILRSRAAVDFDDLLLLTGRLFDEHPQALKRQQQRFDFVQIDEYQDTNSLQFTLIEALVRPHQNLCAVGDDDQSIYGWRGADVRHILGFQQQFPGAKIVRLEENYRSTDKILELANRLVKHNVGRHDKKLRTIKTSRRDVIFDEYPDEVAEAENVVRDIRLLATDHNVLLGDIAILFRTNEQPRVFETELRSAGIKYTLIGGQSFFDRREIRDLLAYLKVIARPDDEASLLRIINTPARGIGSASVDKLLARAVGTRSSVWDVVVSSPVVDELSSAAQNGLKSFRALLERYEKLFAQSPQSMDRTLVGLIEDIDYESEIARQYKTPEQQLTRSAMLDQLVDSVKEYIVRTRKPTLAGYLDETALDGREEEPDDELQHDKQAVTLITLHSAKGLEFPRVYLVGLEEGLLPHRRSVAGTEADIAEERRLAYVGITRAMDELTVTRAATRRKWGKPRPSLPSRFLFEMRGVTTPADITDETQPNAADV